MQKAFEQELCCSQQDLPAITKTSLDFHLLPISPVCSQLLRLSSIILHLLAFRPRHHYLDVRQATGFFSSVAMSCSLLFDFIPLPSFQRTMSIPFKAQRAVAWD